MLGVEAGSGSGGGGLEGGGKSVKISLPSF